MLAMEIHFISEAQLKKFSAMINNYNKLNDEPVDVVSIVELKYANPKSKSCKNN